MGKEEEQYHKLYGDQFTKKKAIKDRPHEKTLTTHAKCRCHERFIIPDWLTEEDVINDLKKWWKTIRLWQRWKRSIMWHLGIYIMSKDFVVITMYKKPLKQTQ